MGHFSMFLILIFNLRLKIILLMIIKGQWYPVLNPNSSPKISNFFYFLHISRGMEQETKIRRMVQKAQDYKQKFRGSGAKLQKRCRFIKKVE